jgi:hypothetical protein
MGEEVEVYSANTVKIDPWRTLEQSRLGLGLAGVNIRLPARNVDWPRRDGHLNDLQSV